MERHIFAIHISSSGAGHAQGSGSERRRSLSTAQEEACRVRAACEAAEEYVQPLLRE